MAMYVVVLITCPGREEAELIADSLLKERLAACANIVPEVTSYFWWTGKIHMAEETILILKTKKGLLRHLVRRVKKMHQYENPEIIALPVIGGSKEYMKWIEDETR